MKPLLLVVLCGTFCLYCAKKPKTQLYDGPARPRSEVVRIRGIGPNEGSNQSAHIKINGKRVSLHRTPMNAAYEVLPGSYDVGVLAICGLFFNRFFDSFTAAAGDTVIYHGDPCSPKRPYHTVCTSLEICRAE
jgi:hypothetical protein